MRDTAEFDSIVQKDRKCYVCGKTVGLEEHHMMSGPNRKLAEAWKLKCLLCYEHHRSPIGVHSDIILKERLEKDAQRAFEKLYGHRKWMELFRKNYL